MVGTAILVLTGVAAAAPAAADPLPGPLGGLLGGSSGGQHHRDRSDYGRTHAEDGELRSGCHNYPYRYVVTPPKNDWLLETFLDDRTGETVASGMYSSDSDPARNRSHFRFCRYSTYAGKFKIRAKLTWYDDQGGAHKVWLNPSYFWLRRP